MKRRCHVLFEQLRKILDRRDHRVLVESIPPKQEYVIYVRLTSKQIDLYNFFVNFIFENGLQRDLFANYFNMSRIWTHPYQLIEHQREVERKQMFQEENDFVVEGSETPDSEESSDEAESK